MEKAPTSVTRLTAIYKEYMNRPEEYRDYSFEFWLLDVKYKDRPKDTSWLHMICTECGFAAGGEFRKILFYVKAKLDPAPSE